jgi:hypothetical protein
MCERASVVDESPVFYCMAIRTDQSHIFERVISTVPILVVESKNLWMFTISAPFAFLNRYASALVCSLESIGRRPERGIGGSAGLTTEPLLIPSPLFDCDFFPAIFASCLHLGNVLQRISLPSAFRRAVAFAPPSSHKSYTANVTRARLLFRKVEAHHFAVALPGAVVGRMLSRSANLKKLLAALTLLRDPRVGAILRSFWPSHMSVLSHIVPKFVRCLYA